MGNIIDPNNSPGDKELRIFVTDADRRSLDIREMSDFIRVGINGIMYELAAQTGEPMHFIQPETVSVIQETLRANRPVARDGYEWVLDYDSLPKEVLKKYRAGVYKDSWSKQVDGNLRAVINDERNKKKAEITLKRVPKNEQTGPRLDSLAIQIQLKQITEKLDCFLELQDYQIERARHDRIVVPFLNARDRVVHAQNENDTEKRRIYLDDSVRELESAINTIYDDIPMLSKRIMILTDPPVLRLNKMIDKFTNWIGQDLQLLAQYVGVLMQVFDYMGKWSDREDAYEKYRRFMLRFCTEAVGRKQLPISLQLHNAYNSYTPDNLDSWKTMTDDMAPMLQKGVSINGAYVISMEADTDEE